jgi:hypothetical protein
MKTGTVHDTNGDGRIDDGDTITWTLTVTNVGNVTLTGIEVSDPTAGPATCPTTTLAPGQSEVCTVPPRTVTAADVAAGKVTNYASASGAQGATAVVTPRESATVPVSATPPPAPPPAMTGVPYLPWLVGGAGLMLVLMLMLMLVLGFGLLLGARRRRS